MFVLDGTKARAVALLMAFATAVPLISEAYAVETPKATVAEGVDAKTPKKAKKKAGTSYTHWGHRAAFGITRLSDRPVAETEHDRKRSALKVVLATARKQLGKPYRWAAVGPSSFDCSGFTMYVWNKAGVNLPHNSSAQRGATRPVSRKQARPGDLVFAPGHVGLYLGDGKMIHSPQTGDHVKISPIHAGTYGFGRPAD